MKIRFVAKKENLSDITLLPFWEKAVVAADFDTTRMLNFLKQSGFEGKAKESSFFYDEESYLLFGMGKKELLDAETLRVLIAASWKKLIEKKQERVHLIFPKVDPSFLEEAVVGIFEGIFLSNYRFDRFKSEKSLLPQELTIEGLDPKWQEKIAFLQTLASGVYFVRDLVNGNAGEVMPSYLAKQAEKMASQNPKIKTQILDEKILQKEGMGLLLAVGQGAQDPPQMIISSYEGAPSSSEKIVLVGKGVTFDSGGLSLKPSDSMLTMKCDMAGAAVVLATVKMAAELGLKVNVTAIAPVAENAIDAKSYKLGDVFQSLNGKTVEVQNTDAEGRLILADALAYAVKYLKPTYLIDVGTLTGAILIALGEEIAGFYANHDLLAKKLEKASLKTSERIWRFPLHDYRDALKSEIADLSNVGGRDAGSMKCALFLEEFVDKTPWAHIDIAGPAYFSKPKSYYPTKGTGWGVRLLIDFLKGQE